MRPVECRRRRADLGWSLQELANRSGINKAYLSEFENGLRNLPLASRSVLDGVLLGAMTRDELCSVLRRSPSRQAAINALLRYVGDPVIDEAYYHPGYH